MIRPYDALQTNDEQIAWILAHPGMNRWLKAALRGARQHDPIAILNDLEILNLLLRGDVSERLRTLGDGRRQS